MNYHASVQEEQDLGIHTLIKSCENSTINV